MTVVVIVEQTVRGGKMKNRWGRKKNEEERGDKMQL